jgi:hypothetical protein
LLREPGDHVWRRRHDVGTPVQQLQHYSNIPRL